MAVRLWEHMAGPMGLGGRCLTVACHLEVHSHKSTAWVSVFLASVLCWGCLGSLVMAETGCRVKRQCTFPHTLFLQ